MSNPINQPGSVTRNLQRLQVDPDNSAAQGELFRRYYRTVLQKAQRRVRHQPVADASDVAISVWDSVFRGIAEGKHQCEDRAEFEELLGKITFHKAVNLFNWLTRKGRHPYRQLEVEEILEAHPLDEDHRQIAERHYVHDEDAEQIAASLGLSVDLVQERLKTIDGWLKKHRHRLENFADPEAAQHFVNGNDVRPYDHLLLEELILSLQEELRETVLLKLKGLSNSEIAERLDVSLRAIQRRLRIVRRVLTS